MVRRSSRAARSVGPLESGQGATQGGEPGAPRAGVPVASNVLDRLHQARPVRTGGAAVASAPDDGRDPGQQIGEGGELELPRREEAAVRLHGAHVLLDRRDDEPDAFRILRVRLEHRGGAHVEGHLVDVLGELHERRALDVPQAELIEDVGVAAGQIGDHQVATEDPFRHLLDDLESARNGWTGDRVPEGLERRPDHVFDQREVAPVGRRTRHPERRDHEAALLRRGHPVPPRPRASGGWRLRARSELPSVEGRRRVKGTTPGIGKLSTRRSFVIVHSVVTTPRQPFLPPHHCSHLRSAGASVKRSRRPSGNTSVSGVAAGVFVMPR